MGIRGPLPRAMRRYVVDLFRRGELATLDEGAQIGGVTRACVHAWLKADCIDWRRARLHRLARHRRSAVAATDGRKLRRPSKDQMRREGERAKAEWDKRHGPDDIRRDQTPLS